MSKTGYFRLQEAAGMLDKSTDVLLDDALIGKVKLYALLGEPLQYDRTRGRGAVATIGPETFIPLSVATCAAVLATGQGSLVEDIQAYAAGKDPQFAGLKGSPPIITERRIFLPRAAVKSTTGFSTRERNACLCTIASLLSYVSGGIPDVRKHPAFIDMRELTKELAGYYEGVEGMAPKALRLRFEEARDVLRRRASAI